MMRDRLIELIKQKSCCYAPCDGVCGECMNSEIFDDSIESIADHLLANGVIVIDTAAVSVDNRPLISQCLGRPLDEIIELVQAKEDGRIIVPPCKVGDTVYVVSRYYGGLWRIHECKVDSLTVYEKHIFMTLIDKDKLNFGMEISEIGKTVFLTREQAEKALAERCAE